MPAHDVDADASQQQPRARHDHRPGQRGRRHVGEEHEAEHEQRRVFGRPEAQGEVGQRRRHQREHDHAEGAGDERADGGDGERGAGAAFPGHGVAVDAGHDGGRLARDAHQDRRGGAAVLRAVVDAGQHDDGLGGVEAEGDRQQYGNAGQRADTRQHADQRADQAAEEGIDQHVRAEGNREAQQQVVEDFHGWLRTP